MKPQTFITNMAVALGGAVLAGATFWGFRLTLVPLLLHVSDATALASGNFPLALWLFSRLLDAPPAPVSSRYVPELYRALLFFVRHARRAAKGAGLQLLTRLLAQWEREQEGRLISYALKKLFNRSVQLLPVGECLSPPLKAADLMSRRRPDFASADLRLLRSVLLPEEGAGDAPPAASGTMTLPPPIDDMRLCERL